MSRVYNLVLILLPTVEDAVVLSPDQKTRDEVDQKNGAKLPRFKGERGVNEEDRGFRIGGLPVHL